MARKKLNDVTNLRSRIRDGFEARPGRAFRPVEVAAALTPPPGTDPAKWPQKVSNEMARMARAGDLHRSEAVVEGRKTPVPVYSHPERTS